LPSEEVAQRLALYGANALREPPAQPAWKLLLSQSSHAMALVLLGAGVLAMLGGRLTLGLIIWGVVAVNAGFSFWQEYRAERAIAALKRILPAHACAPAKAGAGQRLCRAMCRVLRATISWPTRAGGGVGCGLLRLR
jgi:magnesium-transporting ATPase (P-type)